MRIEDMKHLMWGCEDTRKSKYLRLKMIKLVTCVPLPTIARRVGVWGVWYNTAILECQNIEISPEDLKRGSCIRVWGFQILAVRSVRTDLGGKTPNHDLEKWTHLDCAHNLELENMSLSLSMCMLVGQLSFDKVLAIWKLCWYDIWYSVLLKWKYYFADLKLLVWEQNKFCVRQFYEWPCSLKIICPKFNLLFCFQNCILQKLK